MTSRPPGLAFLREAAQHGGAVHAAHEQLDSRAAFVAAVGAARFERFTHAADAHEADDLRRAQALAAAAGLF